MFEGLLQPTHLILILIIALVVLGPGKLPELGRDLGRTIREFRETVKDVESVKDLATAEPAPKKPASEKPVVSAAEKPVASVPEKPAEPAQTDPPSQAA